METALGRLRPALVCSAAEDFAEVRRRYRYAYRLAWFLHPKAAIASRIAHTALVNLPETYAAQARRAEYMPARNLRHRVSLELDHLVQRRVFAFSEEFERERAKQGTLTEEDLTVFFIKEAIRLGLAHASFPMFVSVGRVLHSYPTSGIMDMYGTIAPNRTGLKNDEQCRLWKKKIMDYLFKRFAPYVCIDTTARGERRFRTTECRHLLLLGKASLRQFIPYRTSHSISQDCDRIAPEILNYDGPADGEHGTELLRFHACICPLCLSFLTAAWDLQSPDECAAIPAFAAPPRNFAEDGYEDREAPPDLTDDEVDEALREIAQERERRKLVSPAVLRIFVGGLERATLDFKSGSRVLIPVTDTEEMVEIVSESGVLLSHLVTHGDNDFPTVTRTAYRLGELALCFDESPNRTVALQIQSVSDATSIVDHGRTPLLLQNGCVHRIARVKSANERPRRGFEQVAKKRTGGILARRPVTVLGQRSTRMKLMVAGIAALLVLCAGVAALVYRTFDVRGPRIARSSEKARPGSVPGAQATADGTRRNPPAAGAHVGPHSELLSANADKVPVPSHSRIEIGGFEGSGANSGTALEPAGPSAVPIISPASEPAMRSTPHEEGPALISAPTPSYTEEAKRAGVAGKVSLEVEVDAYGTARVLRVISGLGYGLDEESIAAANGMRFRPAVKDGVPVSSISTIGMVFSPPAQQRGDRRDAGRSAMSRSVAQPERAGEPEASNTPATISNAVQGKADKPPEADVIASSGRAEDALISNLRKAAPLGEAYFQRFVTTEKFGASPESDRYLLARFEWTTKPEMQDLLHYQESRGTGVSEKFTADNRCLTVFSRSWRRIGRNSLRIATSIVSCVASSSAPSAA
jgi:TonB family protein